MYTSGEERLGASVKAITNNVSTARTAARLSAAGAFRQRRMAVRLEDVQTKGTRQYMVDGIVFESVERLTQTIR